ncbi:MAG TPA: glycosyltransferase family 9 protein [Ktedonobacteraceae bacterium]
MQILVIRPGAIGDVLLTFPILQKLRKQYANPHITLVSNSVVLPLALASEIVDQAFDYQGIHWSELFSETGIKTPSLHGLLAQTDLAICWLRDPDHIVEQNISKAGVKHVIVAPGRPPENLHIHIVDHLAATIASTIPNDRGGGVDEGLGPLWPPVLGVRHPRTSRSMRRGGGGVDEGLGPLWPPAMGIHDAPGDHASAHFTPPPPIAIHPGSGSPAKCWPTKYFARVIERLWQQNLPVLLLAGPADLERLETILVLLSSPSKPELLQVLTNKPLLEVAHRLQGCRCYIGNDSGITHLAAMLGIPTVAIFGPSDPTIWHPIGPAVKVIQEHSLEQASVDLIMEAINSFSIDRDRK